MRWLFALLLLVPVAIHAADSPTRSDRIRVLIVDGFSNHDWKLTTKLLRGILAANGRFDVDVSTTPATRDDPAWAQWRPKFSNYDVVIQTCNNLGNGLEWPDVVREDFARYVRDGGGVYIFHSAQNSFRGWKEYEQITGLLWRDKNYGPSIRIDEKGDVVRIPPGEGENTGHPARIEGVIVRLGDHPIHKGLPRAWKTPTLEVYRYCRGPAENLEVISCVRDPEHPEYAWPSEWVTHYGKGRAYVSTFGHVWTGDVQPASLRCAGVQTIIPRVLEWLAGREVDASVPKDFPTDKAVSIRPDVVLPASDQAGS
jgi:type 1 glutamine amidotransferase